jgi:hypothetical protein
MQAEFGVPQWNFGMSTFAFVCRVGVQFKTFAAA